MKLLLIGGTGTIGQAVAAAPRRGSANLARATAATSTNFRR